MNLKEAFAVLEISEDSSPEDAKKQYKKLVKASHPDTNKSPDAEAKLKRINEAYKCVQDGKGNDRQDMFSQSPFHHQQRQYHQVLENIEIHLTIDFKESVLGCKKEAKYSRKTKCPNCSGEGTVNLHNGCAKCRGKGRIVNSQGGMIFVSTCSQCAGKANTETCKSCNGGCAVSAEVSIQISVPAGVSNGATLRLQNMGNYVDTVMNLMDRYTDVFCHIAVKPEVGLSIDGGSVIFNLPISLLDAIRGCQQNVNTIYGNKKIQVPAKSRNRDEVIIPRCGIGGTGSQKVILDVQYPSNMNKLIDVLSEEGVSDGSISNLQ